MKLLIDSLTASCLIISDYIIHFSLITTHTVFLHYFLFLFLLPFLFPIFIGSSSHHPTFLPFLPLLLVPIIFDLHWDTFIDKVHLHMTSSVLNDELECRIPR